MYKKQYICIKEIFFFKFVTNERSEKNEPVDSKISAELRDRWSSGSINYEGLDGGSGIL